MVLGILQGLAEFLPISSSAHLTLAPWVFGWEDPGLAFDVALHALHHVGKQSLQSIVAGNFVSKQSSL